MFELLEKIECLRKQVECASESGNADHVQWLELALAEAERRLRSYLENT